MNKTEALKQIEVFCKETFSQSNCSEWQIKTEDGFSYLQGTLRMFCQCLEAKKIMKPISDFIENEIQPKIDSSRKAKKIVTRN